VNLCLVFTKVFFDFPKVCDNATFVGHCSLSQATDFYNVSIPEDGKRASFQNIKEFGD